MSEAEFRRPLKVRQVECVKAIARCLSERNITPNQISIASVFFAAMAGFSLIQLTDPGSGSSAQWLLLTALFIQCRLLCNLFDGMVAIEGGKGTRSGELFNDAPDRIADPLILIAVGYAVTGIDWGGILGWSAGLLAVFTAYVRTLAVSIGAPADFRGPMAKQHRMAVLTFACLLAAFSDSLLPSDYILMTALAIINLGCLATIVRRLRSAYRYLEDHAD